MKYLASLAVIASIAALGCAPAFSSSIAPQPVREIEHSKLHRGGPQFGECNGQRGARCDCCRPVERSE